MAGGRQRLVPALLLVFLVALGGAWIFANPPGAAPDEASHFFKAVGVGGGDLAGSAPRTKGPTDISEEDYAALSKLLADEQQLTGVREMQETTALRWQRRSAREFTVPARLRFIGFACNLMEPERSSSCLDDGRRAGTAGKVRSFMGTYQPYLYAPAGLSARAAGDPLWGLRLGRVATALLSLGLLAAAALLLWDRGGGGLSLTGLVLALSPTVVFLASTLSTSGPEVCGAICFTAALIRLSRESTAPAWVWLLAGVSGAVVSLSRTLGPVFVLAAIAAMLCLTERRRVRRALGEHRTAAAGAGALLALGAAGGVAWQLAYQPSVGWDRARVRDAIDPSIDALPELGRQVIARFGALEFNLPEPVYVVWGVMLAVLLVIALAVGTWRERLALAGMASGVVVATVALSAVFSQTGFPLQGRHVLPLVVIVPLWAGEILWRHGGRMAAGRAQALVLALFLTAAAIQGFAWYANGRRFAVGIDGDWTFVGDAEWAPPLGWVPWIVLALAGVVAYAAAGAAAVNAARLRASQGD